jgi:ABC-type Fe3+ transport system permease subunit
MPFEKRNVLIIVLGIIVIALGYFIMWVSPTMSAMALTISPIILLIGYLIVVPMGILAGTRTFRKNTAEPPATV